MQTIDRLSELESSFAIPHDRNVLLVSGEDARTFLHGQITVDVTHLENGQVRRTGHCDPKGKSWSVNLITPVDDALLITGHAVGVEASHAQFKKFGVFSKITLEDVTTAFAAYFIKGAEAESAVASVFGELPDTTMSAINTQAGLCIRLDLPDGGLLVLCKTDHLENLQQALSDQGITLYPPAVFEALQIQAGLPEISQPEHIGQFVPQMMNLQALNGIDFKKGCYMGQEVVARTGYLGRNKRAAYVFRVDQAISGIEHMQLEKQLGEHWRGGGTILKAATIGQESWILAVLSNDTTAEDTFRLNENPDAQLIQCDLPYRLEE